jgi:hypothetical protein
MLSFLPRLSTLTAITVCCRAFEIPHFATVDGDEQVEKTVSHLQMAEFHSPHNFKIGLPVMDEPPREHEMRIERMININASTV